MPLPNFRTDVPRHRHAIFNRHTVDWNKGDYVRRSHAGMRASVDIQVDQFGGFAHPANCGFLNGLPIAHQRDDRAVVVGIALAIQQVDAGNLHGVNDGVNFSLVAAFGEVRNTFNERGHK